MSRFRPVLIEDQYFESIKEAAKKLKLARTTVVERCDSKEFLEYQYTEYKISKTKKCCVCGIEKPISEFYPLAHGKYGVAYQCKICNGKSSAKYQKKNPDICKNNSLRWHHGITLEDYNKMFKKQGGKCLICGKHQSELKRPLGVDHDHETKKIRGLLCGQCNFGLGLFNDN